MAITVVRQSLVRPQLVAKAQDPVPVGDFGNGYKDSLVMNTLDLATGGRILQMEGRQD